MNEKLDKIYADTAKAQSKYNEFASEVGYKKQKINLLNDEISQHEDHTKQVENRLGSQLKNEQTRY